MKNTFLGDIKDKWFVALYVLAFIVVTVVVVTINLKEIDYSFSESLEFTEPWTYEYGDGTKGTAVLPTHIEQSPNKSRYLTLVNTLPVIAEETSFIYKAQNSYARISIGGKVVYDKITEEEAKNEWCTLKGIEYALIPIKPTDSGKEVKVELYTSVTRYLANVGEAYVMNKGDFIVTLIRDGYLTVACLVVFATVAVVLGIAWIVVLVMLKQNIKELLYLGLFTLTLAMWLSTESAVVQYLMHGSRGLPVMAMEMLILMPIPMVLFCQQMSIREKSNVHVDMALLIPYIVFNLNNFLHILHICPLSHTLKLTQIILMLEIIYVGYFQISEFVYIKKHFDGYDVRLRRLPLIGIIVLVPLAVLEVCKYTIITRTGSHNGVFISVGLAVYICSLAMDTVSSNALTSIKFQEAAAMKSQFLANMSHEIRTPLNAILGFNEAIIQANKDQKIQKYAQNIQQSGESLKEIINSILDISKIEAGKLEIASIEYSLLDMLDNLVSMMNELAVKKNLVLYTKIEADVPERLIGDEQHLKQVLTNILTNAIKYTANGSVTLTVKVLDKKLENATCRLFFSVKDTGRGIKESERTKLFEKFERLGADKNSNIEGTGLGMAIVTQTLHAMNSEIQLDSTFGEGSDFYFELDQCCVSSEVIGDFNERRNQVSMSKIDNAEFGAPNAHILVVDDVEMNLDAISALLEFTKIKIDTALSGKIAIEKVRQNRYDIIFMDHMMPELDGIETTDCIRNLAVETNDVYYASVPIIALTANVMAGMKERFQQSGMQDYVAKPIELPVLLKALQTWLPKELIVKMEDMPVDKSASQANEVVSEDEWDKEIPEIDMSEAKKYNANFKGFEKNLSSFFRAYENNRTEINRCVQEEDIKNYVIKVHGLKSTSKMIGAMELSNKAMELEAKGNDGQMSAEETEVLFGLYDRAVISIKTYLGISDENDSDDSNCISLDDYNTLIERIKNAAAAFDAMEFMTLDEEVNTINVPKEKQEEFKKLSTFISNMAFGEISSYFDQL